MADYTGLVKDLLHCATSSEACASCNRREERHCQEHLHAEAADAIEELEYALLLMVLQYCTTDDGLLFHEFMTAGENAFAVLGLENGQQEAPLWYKLDRMMQSASERISAKTAPKEETDPCADCRHYPPSSADGKPCCACDPSNPMTNCHDTKEETE